MAIRTIQGTLTIPAFEPETGGIYDDLSVRLFYLTGGTETLEQSSAVTTSNTFEFTYQDSGQQIRVKLIRVSNGVILSETSPRGVLPRSFLKDVPEPNESFDNKNWLFDAGLAILATSTGRPALAKEITEGVLDSQLSGNTIPFSVNHLFGTSEVDASSKTGTVAIVAYAIGYYLEKNPLSTIKVQVADLIYDLLGWILQRKSANHGGLYVGGVGENYASTIDNVLVYFAYKQAGRILNNALYNVADAVADSIYDKLYDSTANRFRYSVFAGGSYNLTDNLEKNLFASLFLIEEDKTTEADDLLQYIEANFKSVDVVNNIDGYKAKTTDSRLWYEGSYGVSILYKKLDKAAKYSEVRRGLNTLLNDDGSFRYGVVKDGVLNVLDYKSVGSTAWGFMANAVPSDVFTISTGSTLTGLPTRYYSDAISSGFTRNNCGMGETGSTVTYSLPAGAFTSTISQGDANDKAQDDIDANGQAYANANGICQIPYVYFNTLRTGYFQNEGCEVQESGTTYTYIIPAASFGSIISQGHAEALADAKLLVDGQAYANSNGTCTLVQQYIVFKPIKTVINTGAYDDIYVSYSAASVVNTGVTISARFRLNSSYSYQPTPVNYIAQGSNLSEPTFLGSVISGSSNDVNIQITGLTPSNFGYQHYVWLEAVDPFGNEQQSAYFIKSCAGNNISASSILEYIVSADTYSVNLNTHQANVLAWKDIAANGQSWVDNNPAATCGALFGNEYQASAFTSNACISPFTGSLYTYFVLANTYQAATLSGANALALADIAANGQNAANAFGSCVLPNNYRRVRLIPRVDEFGMYDNFYVRPKIDGLATANIDLTIGYEIYNDYTGIMTTGFTTTLLTGQNHGTETFGMQVPTHQGVRLRPFVTSITPSTFSGVTYIF